MTVIEALEACVMTKESEMLVTGWAKPRAIRLLATPLGRGHCSHASTRRSSLLSTCWGVSIAPQPDGSKKKAVGVRRRCDGLFVLGPVNNRNRMVQRTQ